MDLDTSKSIRVLLVDDDHDDYVITKQIFSRIKDSPFVLEWTDSFDTARELIEKRQHDIYLIDYLLGEHTGLELLKLAEPEKHFQPFILLTGAGSEEVAWRSIELSASDYLVKGSFDASLLSRTLYYALQRKRSEEQRLQHLVDLNRSKDEFISIASHQLRTPATGVKQYVAMLLEGYAGTLSPPQTALLKKAYESNERQLKIVSDLLKVAQVDAGKVMLHKKPVALNQLIGDVTRDLREIISDQQQTISCELPDYDIVLSIDEASIRMVLENIIDNASKYSQENTAIQVVVRDLKHHVVISIIDEGVGIDPEGMSRLFQKFSRLDNVLSTKVSGSGLGLYWARKIVDLHNGAINYDANKVKGTTFNIKLPKDDKV